MCVSCSDTVSRSGMFCAIATTIERCKTEGVVDVFQVVKALRVRKPGAVHTVVSGYIDYQSYDVIYIYTHSCSSRLSLRLFWCTSILLLSTQTLNDPWLDVNFVLAFVYLLHDNDYIVGLLAAFL